MMAKTAIGLTPRGAHSIVAAVKFTHTVSLRDKAEPEKEDDLCTLLLFNSLRKRSTPWYPAPENDLSLITLQTIVYPLS